MSEILLPDGTPYDRASVQDHTDLTFSGRMEQKQRKAQHKPENFMTEPAWLACPLCTGDTFYILAESSPRGDGAVQFYCKACKGSFPVVEMHQPQMRNSIAKNLGLPQAQPTINLEF